MVLINKSALKNISCEEFDARESTIDTQYFGVASAKVILKKSCSVDRVKSQLLGFFQDFEFITITNKENNPSNNQWLGEKTKAFLTDVNMQFSKKVSKFTEKHDDGFTVITDNLPHNKRIIQIAETSFRYSRFLNDPYLSSEKARYIYGDITKNAFRKMGSFFVVIENAKETIGFLLFSIDRTTSSSTIDLLATDQNYQGRGIGRALIRSMEHYVAQKDVETIKVGTQLNNIDAMGFYTSNGFRYFECNSIYHYWPLRD